MGLFDKGVDFWNDPNSAWTRDWDKEGKTLDGFLGAAGKGVTDLGTSLGFIPKQVDPNAPGGSLDTSNADEESARLGPLIAQLTQQAATGGGSWEDTLKAGTQSAVNSASALGQSQPGVGYASALRNIGNAQAGANQRSVGEGNILREQSKTGAQDQLAQLLSSQGDTEANQAAAGAAANQGVHDLQASLNQQASKSMSNVVTSGGGALGALSKMSNGGEVPGKPKVFGDDEKNDTVPAWLSPGEGVVPRSHMDSPDHAKQFIDALFASKGVQHFDGGGQAGDGTGLNNSTDTSNLGWGAASIAAPHIISGVGSYEANKPNAASIANGALFNMEGYDANRAATLQNSNLLAGRAMGNGPSVAAQQTGNQTDANIAAAMGAHRMPAGEVLGRTVAANQGAAGEGAETKMGEQFSGAHQLAAALANQRNRDNAMAQAQQQAAFRNTQINAGLDLSQQAQLRGILSGAGQAAVAISRMKFGNSDSQNAANDFGSGATSGAASAALHNPGGEDGGDPVPDNVDGGYAEGGRVMTPPRRAERPLSPYADRKVPAIQMANGVPVDELDKYRNTEKNDDSLEELQVQRAHGGFIEALKGAARRAGDAVGMPVPAGNEASAVAHYLGQGMGLQPLTPFDAAAEARRVDPKQAKVMDMGGAMFAGAPTAGSSRLSMFPSPEESMANMEREAVMRDAMEAKGAAPLPNRQPEMAIAQKAHEAGLADVDDTDFTPAQLDAQEQTQQRIEAAQAANSRHRGEYSQTNASNLGPRMFLESQNAAADATPVTQPLADIPASKNLPGQRGLEEYLSAMFGPTKKAHGGVIPPAEKKRADAFIKALKSRAA